MTVFKKAEDTLKPSGDAVKEYHDTFWKHCLRCDHCQWRTTEDRTKKKKRGVVPTGGMLLEPRKLPVETPFYFMNEFPDSNQAETGYIDGDTGSGKSPMYLTLLTVLQSLESFLPDNFLQESGVGFALGCKPVDLSNTAMNVKPSASHAKACRPRWQTELALANPYLTYLGGSSALAVAIPQYRTQYKIVRGEILPASMWTTRNILSSPKEVPSYMYVGSSIEVAIRTAREDQWDISEWEPYPCATPLTEPVKDLLWHLVWYAWLSSSIRDIHLNPGHTTFDPRFLDLVERLNTYYDSFTQEVFDIEQFLQQYSDSREVRNAMLTDAEEEVELEELDELDDLEEEEEDE